MLQAVARNNRLVRRCTPDCPPDNESRMRQPIVVSIPYTLHFAEPGAVAAGAPATTLNVIPRAYAGRSAIFAIAEAALRDNL